MCTSLIAKDDTKRTQEQQDVKVQADHVEEVTVKGVIVGTRQPVDFLVGKSEMMSELDCRQWDEEYVSLMIEHHINMTKEEAESDEEIEPSTDEETKEEAETIDAEVHFTKVDTADIRKLWTEEDKACTRHYQDAARPIVIAWQNVNGIGSFLKHLRKEGASYFKPETLYPDVFGILEAKVSEASTQSVALITVLKELIEELTGHKYIVVQSLRRSTSRCGTIGFLKISFLETREWWTWSSDLEVYDPTYMDLQSAGYVCSSRRELSPHNEWNRKTETGE